MSGDFDTAELDTFSGDDYADTDVDTTAEHGGAVGSLDSVASYLLGDEGALDGVGDKDDSGERTAGSKDFIVRRHDDPDQPAPREKPMDNPSMPLDRSQDIQTNQQIMAQADNNYQNIQEMLMRGEITPQQAQQMHAENGARWFEARHNAMEAELEMRDREIFMRESHQKMTEMIPDWGDMQKREQMQKAGVQFLRDTGFSQQEIGELDDPRAAAVVMKAMHFESENKRLQLENAKLKQERRNRQRGLKEAQRHSGRGSPTKQRASIDRVADILLGGDGK